MPLETINELFPENWLSIDRHLASGGSGDLYIGKQAALGRQVAIKLIPVSHYGADEEAILREGRIAAMLKHPHIVAVHDARIIGDKDERYCCLVMELIEGKNLSQSPPLSPPEILPLMVGICEAMSYAHEKGIIHCDLKPANILIDAIGSPKITDFGISRLSGADSESPFLVSGDYLAPEQKKPESKPDDHRRDVYSIGQILLQLLHQAAPGIEKNHREDYLKTKMLRIAEKAAMENPEERTSSVAEMTSALEKLLPASTASLKRNYLIAALLVSLITVIGFASWKSRETPPPSNLPAPDSRFAEEAHPTPLPIITDISPTEILTTDKGFWLEIRGQNFDPSQKYYGFASDLVLAKNTEDDNSPVVFIDETRLKVFVESVAPNAPHDGEAYVSVRWGNHVDHDVTGKFHHAYTITSIRPD